MNSEFDRRKVETYAGIISELRESSELSHCEIVEAKEKDETAKAVRKQLDNELKLELMAEVDRKIVSEVDKKQRAKIKNQIEKSREKMIEEEE